MFNRHIIDVFEGELLKATSRGEKHVSTPRPSTWGSHRFDRHHDVPQPKEGKMHQAAISPRDPSTFSEDTWTLQT